MKSEEDIREAFKHDEPTLRTMTAIEKMKHEPYLYGWLDALKWVLNDKEDDE